MKFRMLKAHIKHESRKKLCMITDIAQKNTLIFAHDLKIELDIWMTYADNFREIEKAMDISVGAISSYPILN